MFSIGDKVVYPMHGAGVIEAIEEKEVLGERKQYYILRFPMGNLKVMVPIANGHEIGLRRVIDAEGVQKVFRILGEKSTTMSSNWNQRYKANLEKMRSGNIYEVAEVVRNLARRDREKGLSSGEKRMLENARQILISELALAAGMGREQAQALVDSACL